MSPPGTRRSGRRRGRCSESNVTYVVGLPAGLPWCSRRSRPRCSDDEGSGGAFCLVDRRLRNIGGSLLVAVDVGGQAIAKREEIGPSAGVAVDVVLVADVQNVHTQVAACRRVRGEQQRREKLATVVQKPPAARLVLLSRMTRSTSVSAGSSLAGLASFSARFPSAVPVWPAPHPDARTTMPLGSPPASLMAFAMPWAQPRTGQPAACL